MSLLDNINSPADLRSLDQHQLQELCGEIRTFLIKSVAESGGHLASNLGAVELTVALHRVYDTSVDRLVFDVGHQCYTHKILTGRKDCFNTLRSFGGISGFPLPSESPHDSFIAGHASNSVSVALGMARARTAMHKEFDVVAVIGDGSLSGGMAMEGLSDAGHSGEPIVIVLNDNGMSISRSGGGLARMLSRIRTKPEYINFKRWYRHAFAPRVPYIFKLTHRLKHWIKQRVVADNIFDDFGFEYLGPVDGHDIEKLETALRWAKDQGRPCLVHVITKKGYGYEPAEREPERFHGIGAFDPLTGEERSSGKDFSSVFGEALCQLAAADDRVTAITAAMKEGTGLSAFQERFPDRFFDVGIAEEHACALAGGMASQGMIPVFAVYSTFLQRCCDMLIHDISLMGLHAVFAVDRAGIVGKDGITHQGVFDVSILSAVPGMKIYAPASFRELRSMLDTAVLSDGGPAAIRYPRGGEYFYSDDLSGEPSVLMREGNDVTIAVYGQQTGHALKAADILAEDDIQADIVKFNLICPVDIKVLASSVKKTGVLIIAEETASAGGIGQQITAELLRQNVYPRVVRRIDLGEGILEHGDAAVLRKIKHLDAEGISGAVKETLHNENKT